MKGWAGCGVLAGLAVLPALAMAGTDGRGDRIALSAGVFDTAALGPSRPVRRAAELRLDYHWGVSLVPALGRNVRAGPWAGVQITADGAFWGGGGLMLEASLGSFYVQPSVGIGVYARGGGKDMGAPVEVRSTLELGYRFENEARVGVYLSHMSNAGLGRDNPGANTFGGVISLPVSRLLPTP